MDNLVGIGILAFIIIFIFVFLATHRKTALPNEVLIISGAFIGGKHAYTDSNGNKVKLITNGGSFVIPILQRAALLNLNSRTIDLVTPEVYTQKGVPIKITGTVILKIGSTQEEIATAAEQFLGKDDKEINAEATEVVEGHARAILGTQTVEDLYQNRDSFAESVQNVAVPDLAKMGLQVISFTIKDISDENDYLKALGQAQIAEVKRDAQIAAAKANSDMRIKTAESEQQAQQQEIERQTQIKDAERAQAIAMAKYDQDQKTAEAQAQQEIINAQMANKQLQMEKDIALAEQDAELADRKLKATTYKEADAKLYAARQQAEADKATKVKAAEAEAEQVKVRSEAQARATEITGDANAKQIEAEGLAHAKATEKQAEALAKMNETGKLQMIVDKLPDIIAAQASAYNKVDHITMLTDGDPTSATVNNLAKTFNMLKETTAIDVPALLNGAMTQRAGNQDIVNAIDQGEEQPAAPAKKASEAKTTTSEESSKA